MGRPESAGRDQPAGSSGAALTGVQWLLVGLVAWILVGFPLAMLVGPILARRRKCDTRRVTPED